MVSTTSNENSASIADLGKIAICSKNFKEELYQVPAEGNSRRYAHAKL